MRELDVKKAPEKTRNTSEVSPIERKYNSLSDDDKAEVNYLAEITSNANDLYSTKRTEEFKDKSLNENWNEYDEGVVEEFFDGVYNTAVVGTMNGISNLIPTVAQALGSDDKIWQDWQYSVDKTMKDWENTTSDSPGFAYDLGSGVGFVLPLLASGGVSWIANAGKLGKIGGVLSSSRVNSFLTGTTLMYNDLRKEAVGLGMDRQNAARLAFMTAGIVSLTEGAALESIGKTVSKVVTRKIGKQGMENAIVSYGTGKMSQSKFQLYSKGIQSNMLGGIARVGSKIFEGGMKEAGQEFSQTYIEEGLKRFYDKAFVDGDKMGEWSDLDPTTDEGFDMFKEAAYSASIGAIIGGGMSGGGYAIKGNAREELMYGAINSAVKKGDLSKVEELKGLVDKKVVDRTYTEERGEEIKSDIDEMTENSKQANSIGLKDEVSHYQLYQLRRADKKIKENADIKESVVTEDNKLVVTDSMKKAFKKNKAQSGKLTNFIEQKVNEIVESGKKDTSNPDKFNDLLTDINGVYEMINENAPDDKIDKALEKLGVRYVKPQKTEKVVPGVDHKKVDKSKPIEEPKTEKLSIDKEKQVKDLEEQVQAYEAQKEGANQKATEFLDKKIQDKKAKIESIKSPDEKKEEKPEVKESVSKPTPATEKVIPENETDFDKYVRTGEVSDKVVDDIAEKISKNKSLTKEEHAMREGSADRIEKKLKSKKEFKSKKETKVTSKKGSVSYEKPNGEKYEIIDGKVYNKNNNQNITNTPQGREVKIESELEQGKAVKKEITDSSGKTKEYIRTSDGEIYTVNLRGEYSKIDKPEVQEKFNEQLDLFGKDIDRGGKDLTLEGDTNEQDAPASSALIDKVQKDIEKKTTKKKLNVEENSYDLSSNKSQLGNFLDNILNEDVKSKDDPDFNKTSRFNNIASTNNPGTDLTFGELTNYFKKIFPNISVKSVQKITDKFGNRVLGKITGLGIEIQNGKAFQIPLVHEYSHAYYLAKGGSNNPLLQQGIDMIKESSYFKEAQRLYPELSIEDQAEEALVQAIAEKSYEKLKSKLNDPSLLNRFVSFAKRFWTSVKSLFSKDKSKDILDVLSKDFLNTNNSYQTNLGGPSLKKYSKDSKVTDTITFVNDRIIEGIIKGSQGIIEDENFNHIEIIQQTFSSLMNEYEARNNVENMFSGVEINYEKGNLGSFNSSLKEQIPEIYEAFEKGVSHFLSTPIEKIKTDLEGDSNKANIKNDRKLSTTVQNIMSFILDSNGDPISKGSINEYITGVSQKADNYSEFNKMLEVDSNTNHIAGRLNQILKRLGDGYRNPLAQEFNSMYIDRVTKSLIQENRIVSRDLNVNRDIEKDAKEISDRVSEKNYTSNDENGGTFFYKRRNAQGILGNFYTDFIKGKSKDQQKVSFILQHDYLKGRFYETIKSVFNQDIDRSAFDQWLKDDVVNSLDLLPNKMYFTSREGSKFKDNFTSVFSKLLVRNSGGNNTSPDYISIKSNNENSVRPGSSMDRFNTKYIYNKEFQDKINNSPYFKGNYYLEHILKNKQVQFNVLDGVENMVTGQVKEYTDQNATETVLRDLSNYMQMGNTYLQNIGINGRGYTTTSKMPKRSPLQLSEDFQYQADLDSKILNDLIKSIPVDFDFIKSEYAKISFNEIVENSNGSVSINPAFNIDSKGNVKTNNELESRVKDIISNFTENNVVRSKYKTTILNPLKFGNLDIDTDVDKVRHFILNDHIARNQIANVYAGAMSQKIQPGKDVSSDFIKRFGIMNSTGTHEDIDKPVKHIVFRVPNIDNRAGSEKNMSDSMEVMGNDLYQRLLTNHGDLGGVGLNMKGLVAQVNPETGKSLQIKKSSIAAVDLNQFDNHENPNELPSNGMVTWSNIQLMSNTLNEYYKDKGLYSTMIDESTIKGQDMLELTSDEKVINLSDPKFWVDGKLNKELLIEAAETQDSTREMQNMSTTFDINVDYSKKDIENIEATASTQLMSIAQDGLGVDGGITSSDINEFQSLIVDKLKENLGVKGDDYSESRVIDSLMNNPSLLKKIRTNAIESENKVIEDLANKILDRSIVKNTPKKIQENISKGESVLDLVDDLEMSYKNLLDEKGESLVSKLKEELGYRDNTDGTLNELDLHGDTFNEITKFDIPNLKGLLEGTISKVLNKNGLKLKLPGSYLHAIPDYGKNLNWYPREGLVARDADGDVMAEDLPSVAVNWSMFADSLEKANNLLKQANATGKGLRINAVRVPASHGVSKFTARVEYFTDGTANTVILPIEFIEASDSDHDGDKLFVYREPLKMDEGKVIIDKDSTDYKLFNKLNKMLSTDHQIESTRKNLKLDSLHEVANILKEGKDVGEDLSKGIRDTASMNSIGERLSFASSAIGILALAGKQHNMLLRNNVTLNEKISLPIGVEGGEINYKDVKSFTSDQQYEVAKLLQSALDVVKDPVFVELGITKENIGVVKTLLMLGVDLKTTLQFANNDVLTTVMNNVKNSTNIYSGEKTSFNKMFKEASEKYDGFDKSVLDTFSKIDSLGQNLDKLLSVIRLDSGLPSNQNSFLKIIGDIKELKSGKDLGFSLNSIMEEPIVNHNIDMASEYYKLLKDKLLSYNDSFVKTVDDYNKKYFRNITYTKAFESIANTFAQKNSFDDIINIIPKDIEKSLIGDIEVIKSLQNNEDSTVELEGIEEQDSSRLKIIAPGYDYSKSIVGQTHLVNQKALTNFIEKAKKNPSLIKKWDNIMKDYHRLDSLAGVYDKYKDNLFLENIDVYTLKSGNKTIVPRNSYYGITKEAKAQIVEAYQDLKKDLPELAGRLEAYQMLRFGATDKKGSLKNLIGSNNDLDLMDDFSSNVENYLENKSEAVNANLFLDNLNLDTPMSVINRAGLYKSQTLTKFNTDPKTKAQVKKEREDLDKNCNIS